MKEYKFEVGKYYKYKFADSWWKQVYVKRRTQHFVVLGNDKRYYIRKNMNYESIFIVDIFGTFRVDSLPL